MTIRTSINHEPWGREESRQPSPPSRAETIASIAAGSVLAALGASRRSWKGAVLAAGGGYLVYRGLAARPHPLQGGIRVRFNINRASDEVYRFIRDLSNWQAVIPEFQVERNDGRSLDLSFASRGTPIHSQIQITDERENEFVAWSSLPGAFEHRGVLHVRNAGADRGTDISVALEYVTAAGPVRSALAKSRGKHPEQLVREGLRRIKQLLEAGEIPTTEGQPAGSRGIRGKAARLAMRERVGEREPAKMAGD
jgi:uncharacterized membrane protein